jgi:FKBP-type peptidyl-prolyl cis-trans isomerase (trigger factor)
LAAIWEKVIENSAIEVPKQQYDYYYNNYHYDIETYAPMYNMTYDEFLKNGGAPYFFGIDVYSEAELIKYINDMIKKDIVLETIIKAEGLVVTEEEYKNFVAELVALSGKTEAETIKQYGGEEALKAKLLSEKVDNLIYEENNLTEKN